MATIVNISDITLQATVPRIEPVPLAGTYYIPGTTLIAGDTAVTIQSNAANAISLATALDEELANISSDDFLSPVEKPSVVLNYDTILLEQISLDAQATSLGITTEKTNYDTKITALTAYLNSITGWNVIPGTDVAIVGSTFRTKFSDVYDTKQILLNKLAAVAAITATWTSVASRPTDLTGLNSTEGNKLTGIQNGATLGANFTTNLTNKPTTVVGYASNFGSAAFTGNILGTAGINISGIAKFTGVFADSGGVNTSIEALQSSIGSAITGRISAAGNAVLGVSSGTSGNGISGIASGTGYGVIAQNPAAVALYVNGRMEVSNSTMVNNLNANYVGGRAVTNICSIVTTQSGVATASGNGLQFSMAGTLAASYRTIGSGNTFQVTDISDSRVKQDIQDEVLGLSFIVNYVHPKTFRMKENPKLKHHGFIADDMCKIFPSPNVDSLLTQAEDGMYGIGYLALLAPMINAIKELNTLVEKQNLQLQQLLEVQTQCLDK